MDKTTEYIWLYRDKDKTSFFRDLVSEKNHFFICLPAYKAVKTKAGRYWEKLMLGNRFRKMIPEKLRARRYNIGNYEYLEDKTYVVLMGTQVVAHYSTSYLLMFKKEHPNVKLYAIACDSMHASSSHMDHVRDKLLSGVFDKVLTYDRFDAEEYGFTWFGYSYYSEMPYEITDRQPYDAYFVGIDKGNRGKTISSLYSFLVKNNVNVCFDVPRPKKNAQEDFPYIKKGIPYSEVLGKVNCTNTLIEILQSGQQSQSLRYFEAVKFNKKLLTNNRHLSELPYYDERYMRFFETEDDIDIEWVKKVEEIDYGYKGEFSPLHLEQFLKSIEDDHE